LPKKNNFVKYYTELKRLQKGGIRQVGTDVRERRRQNKARGKNFADMFKEFAVPLSEIFNDPGLREKAREFGESAAASAKFLQAGFKDEDVRKDNLRTVGRAAKNFGEGVSGLF